MIFWMVIKRVLKDQKNLGWSKMRYIIVTLSLSKEEESVRGGRKFVRLDLVIATLLVRQKKKTERNSLSHELLLVFMFMTNGQGGNPTFLRYPKEPVANCETACTRARVLLAFVCPGHACTESQAWFYLSRLVPFGQICFSWEIQFRLVRFVSDERFPLSTGITSSFKSTPQEHRNTSCCSVLTDMLYIQYLGLHRYVIIDTWSEPSGYFSRKRKKKQSSCAMAPSIAEVKPGAAAGAISQSPIFQVKAARCPVRTKTARAWSVTKISTDFF